MSNLLQRLKPEYLDKLEDEAKDFPSIVGYIYKQLELNTRWVDLSYGFVCELLRHLRVKDYSPSAVANLFED